MTLYKEHTTGLSNAGAPKQGPIQGLILTRNLWVHGLPELGEMSTTLCHIFLFLVHLLRKIIVWAGLTSGQRSGR